MKNIFTLTAMVFLALPDKVFCETMTLDTYYPSPAGIYTNVTVTSSTVLARDGGTVSVGSQARPADLSVKGNSTFSGVVVPGNLPADPTLPAQKVEGAIYYNTVMKKHRVYKNGAWTDLGGNDFVLASEVPCTEKLAGQKAVDVGERDNTLAGIANWSRGGWGPEGQHYGYTLQIFTCVYGDIPLPPGVLVDLFKNTRGKIWHWQH